MNKKRRWITFWLFILMWTQTASNYINFDEKGFSFWWLFGLIDVILITFIMLFIPFLFRMFNKKKLDIKKGKNICKWNSIGMFILSLILTISLDGNNIMGIGGLGAIIFFYINKWLFVAENANDTINISNQKSKQNVTNKNKDIFCRNCGNKLNNNKKCEKCGKQYFNFKYYIKYLPYLIIIVLIIIIIVLSNKIINNNKEITKLKNKKTNYIIENNNEEYLQYWQKNHNKVDFIDENIVFVIEGYGNYYYSYDCMMDIVNGNFTYWAYNKEQAIYNGYQKGKCN